MRIQNNRRKYSIQFGTMMQVCTLYEHCSRKIDNFIFTIIQGEVEEILQPVTLFMKLFGVLF